MPSKFHHVSKEGVNSTKLSFWCPVMIAPQKLPFGIKRPDDDENDDNDDAGDNEDDDNADVDDNGRESAVWGLPGFYSHFPSPGRPYLIIPHIGGGGRNGMLKDL